jgi:hypothetical protein
LEAGLGTDHERGCQEQYAGGGYEGGSDDSVAGALLCFTELVPGAESSGVEVAVELLAVVHEEACAGRDDGDGDED